MKGSEMPITHLSSLPRASEVFDNLRARFGEEKAFAALHLAALSLTARGIREGHHNSRVEAADEIMAHANKIASSLNIPPEDLNPLSRILFDDISESENDPPTNRRNS